MGVVCEEEDEDGKGRMKRIMFGESSSVVAYIMCMDTFDAKGCREGRFEISMYVCRCLLSSHRSFRGR